MRNWIQVPISIYLTDTTFWNSYNNQGIAIHIVSDNIIEEAV